MTVKQIDTEWTKCVYDESNVCINNPKDADKHWVIVHFEDYEIDPNKVVIYDILLVAFVCDDDTWMDVNTGKIYDARQLNKGYVSHFAEYFEPSLPSELDKERGKK